MSSSQHDGASDESKKRHGNGSQDRWHQRAGSGARGGRGSGSLRHDCAAHCSHHHNGDQGGAPHCCQSRSHCAAADDDEGSTQTNKNRERRFALLCFLANLFVSQMCRFKENLLCLIDWLLLQEEEEEEEEEEERSRT